MRLPSSWCPAPRTVERDGVEFFSVEEVGSQRNRQLSDLPGVYSLAKTLCNPSIRIL